MDFRKLNKNDLSGLLSLYEHLHESDVIPDIEAAEEVWRQTEKSGFITYWGLFVNDVLVSCCQLVVTPNFTRNCKPYCLIENVVTHSSYRNKGFGKALLCHVLNYAWSLGCYKAMLMTGRKDEAVFNFYKSVGFNSSEKQAFIAKPQST